ncbi:MAG: alpha-galactosidase [Chitinophaga sp.]|uniref:alpha-galactosidase n=1 Tax=Chitinophaga sp. TaxID=1869181 RepID=UPI001B1991D7|nr:alpha-galactosidase [Chitinophaga sp.]MBO9730315.1 alpha-galactosidase [Chitinophaga sp.]
MITKTITLLLAAVTSATATLSAQQIITVETKNNALVMETDAEKSLLVTYFGARADNINEYRLLRSLDKFKPGNDDLFNKREIYMGSGSLNLLEPALAVTHYNGDKSLVLQYVTHQVKQLDDNRTLTSIQLKDSVYNVMVTLYMEAYRKEDVIEQWAEIIHHEKGDILLNKYASANLTLQGKAFYLNNHYSSWGQEMQPEEQLLPHGLRTIDSKLGTRNNLLHSSSFMVSLDKPATEDEGQVIAGSLEWTGNFRLDFETFDEYYLRVTAGINNAAANYTLKPNEPFVTPKFVYTLSDKGKGLASRNLQHWARQYRLLNGTGDRYTLLNNWETTYFDFDDAKLEALIQDAKKLGTNVFLLDDGWFGNKYPRNNATGGLGDWQVNRAKLKKGLGHLDQVAKENGVKFGIWIEPEMVNPNSELYEKHPDWVLKEPGRKEYYMRNQLVLDLSNPQVQDFVYESIDNLFKEAPGLSFIKWDCNSLIYNAHSATLKNQDHLNFEYVRGLYRVLEKIRKKYPDVAMMLCAGGGSRVDYGALQYFTEFWASDNTNAYDRIFIQWDYSYYFPSIAVDNHVTDMGRQPIKFKTDVAMMGKLGFDIKVNELSPNDLLFCQQAIRLYDSFKDIVWHGDQYRLQDPRHNKVASIAYVDAKKEEAVVFNYHMPATFVTTLQLPIKMKGLDPGKQYTIEEINLYPGSTTPLNPTQTYSGDFLMKIGFNPQTSARRTSVILRIKATR